MFDNLTEENILLYATKAYDKPNCVMSEFLEDMKRFNYLNKLFMRYRKYDELRERLILNHLMVLYNVFEHRALTRMLAFKLYDHLPLLKPFLVLLNYWPERIENIGPNSETIRSNDVMMDMRIVEVLRKI